MGVWKPGEIIKDGEVVGRRVFDKKLECISSFSDVSRNIFLDSRLSDDLSIDRLGEGNPQKSVVIRLTKLGDDAANTLGTRFHGWIAAHKKHVKYEAVRPDPLTEKLDGIENPYHALIDRSDAREKTQAYHLSRSLLFTFMEQGFIVNPIRAAK